MQSDIRRAVLAVAAVAAAIPLALTPAMSASGSDTAIAFHDDPGGADDVFLLEPTSGHVRRLTNGLEAVATPVWSPDGTRVAFLGRADGVADIYVAKANNGEIVRLTHSSGEHYALSWSPDGKRLAFVCCSEQSQAIYVMNADGTHRSRIARHAGQPTWSPNGRKLAFLSLRDGNAELYSMDPTGRGLRRLTRSRQEDADPAWSPDGRRIAFDSRRIHGRSQIYVMAADGSHPKRLVADRWNDQQPSWSPNGKRILFTSFRNRDPNLRGIGNAEIITVDANGSQPRNLTHSAAWEGDPVWSPDGSSIAYAVRRDFGPRGLFDVETMSVDGGGRRSFPAVQQLAANACCPAWQP